MKIGLDLDETITEFPTFFACLTQCMTTQGHEIHILTYRDQETRQHTEEELTKLNIAYTQLHLPSDHELPEAWKSSLATRLKLDIIIDDSPEVLAALPAKTKRLWFCNPEVFDLGVCVTALRNHSQASRIKLPIIR